MVEMGNANPLSMILKEMEEIYNILDDLDREEI